MAVLVMMVTAGPARAQTYGPQPLGITCTVVVGPGLSLRCTTTGFQPGASLTFTIFSAPTGLGTASADANGRASLAVALPAGLAAGDHRVEAVGQAASGGTVTVATTVTLPGNSVAGTTVDAGGTSLPRTGSDAALLASIGSASVAAGGLLVFATRRRRRHVNPAAGA